MLYEVITRLSGSGVGIHGYHSEPDRAGHRGDRHDHERLPLHQSDNFVLDECLQLV